MISINILVVEYLSIALFVEVKQKGQYRDDFTRYGAKKRELRRRINRRSEKRSTLANVPVQNNPLNPPINILSLMNQLIRAFPG